MSAVKSALRTLLVIEPRTEHDEGLVFAEIIDRREPKIIEVLKREAGRLSVALGAPADAHDAFPVRTDPAQLGRASR